MCDYVEKNLLSLYEEDYIYDKFFMDISPCNNYILTGAYNKSGHLFDVNGTFNLTLPTNFDVKRGKGVGLPKKYNNNKKLPTEGTSGTVDFKKKVITGAWSPVENTCALAFRNCIFLFSDKTGR